MGAADSAHIAELFAGFGPVNVRRMFGGAGIFAGGVMIALVADGVIYLKADRATIPAFEQEGMGAFSYDTRTGRRSLGSYWRMPERLYDNPEELAGWARQAYAAALNAGGTGKPGPKRQGAKRRARPARRAKAATKKK